jgi:hypothetical protein
MKNFFVLTAFLFTTLTGLVFSNLFQPKTGIEQSFYQNNFCEVTDSGEKYFTLDEANEIFGKKVISKDRDFNFEKSGRIISYEMVSPDKLLIEIYWGNGADDENSTVTFHDKTSFPENFEIVN